MLAHALHLGHKRFSKGAIVDAAILGAAREAGLQSLWVARLEPGDVAEDDAALRVAKQIAGPGITLRPPAHGRVNLQASHDGLLLLEADSIRAANGLSESLAVATLPPNTPVRAGDLVGTVKIIPFALPGQLMAAVQDVPGGTLLIQRWQTGLKAALIQTRLPETPDKLVAKTVEVTEARLARLGIAMARASDVPHEVDRLAGSLEAASKADLVLIAGAAATSDRRDVIPAALVAAGGTVLRVGMPVDPGNLLVLGRLGGATVIGLPGCAKSPRRNGLDLVLERLAAGLPTTAEHIARMGVGGLLEESGRPVPWAWSA